MRFAFLSAVMLLVAACNKNPLEVTVSRCFGVAVVGDVGTLTKFKGVSRTTADVEYTASIMDVTSSCVEEADVKAQLDFYIGAQAGPALANSSITVPYFVAVVKDNSQLVSKRIYDVTLKFDGSGIARSHEMLTQLIPSIEQARRYNYELLVGFQVDADSAVYNMQR
ncbi:hypothetical protein [Kordiimonas pumila]|uniref:Lipoprotein n=1 Tax=Kordiimonas pumila TaxID=2161677 RepID=A0ABV7D949_9PROT|nr:hypothetical protein [Kordiimonas pumila]